MNINRSWDNDHTNSPWKINRMVNVWSRGQDTQKKNKIHLLCAVTDVDQDTPEKEISNLRGAVWVTPKYRID